MKFPKVLFKVVNFLRKCVGVVPLDIYTNMPSDEAIMVKFKVVPGKLDAPTIKWPKRKKQFVSISLKVLEMLKPATTFKERSFIGYNKILVIDYSNVNDSYVQIRTHRRHLVHAIKNRIIIPEYGGVIDIYQKYLDEVNEVVRLLETIIIDCEKVKPRYNKGTAITFVMPVASPRLNRMIRGYNV